MYLTQVIYAISGLLSVAYGSGFGGGQGGGQGGGGFGYGGGLENHAPRPYDFGYAAPDSMGNSHFRSEKGDGSGSVQGSYGYTDNQGLFRKVEYVANAGGFRANVHTNEPGTDGKENPADVNMNAQPAPAGIQSKYSSFGGGFGAGGQGGGFGGGGLFAGIPRSSHSKSSY